MENGKLGFEQTKERPECESRGRGREASLGGGAASGKSRGLGSGASAPLRAGTALRRHVLNRIPGKTRVLGGCDSLIKPEIVRFIHLFAVPGRPVVGFTVCFWGGLKSSTHWAPPREGTR